MKSEEGHSAAGTGSGGRVLPRILLVEDDELVRSYVATVLEVGGFDVLETTDGAQALEQFEVHAKTLAAVILDMTLPRLTGTMVLPRLRAIRQDIPIILTSGMLDLDGVRMDDDRTTFLPKPFTPDQLLQALDKFHS